MLSSSLKKWELTKKMIHLKADLNLTDNKNCNILHFYTASDYTDLSFLNLLLKNKINLNTKNDKESTPLHLICLNPNKDFSIQVIKLLIENKSEIDSLQCNGWSPFHFVCDNSHYDSTDLIPYFIENKANLNIKNSIGESPLHYACENNYLSLNNISYLVDQKCDVNSLNDVNESTLYFHLRNRSPKLETIKYLVENKVSPSHNSNEGLTPLHLAAKTNSFEILKYLVDSKSALNQLTNEDGLSPLSYACRFSDKDSINYLIESRCDVNITTDKTPLHILSLLQKLDLNLAKKLINNGADINQIDDYSYTPLHYLSLNCLDVSIFKYFFENNADLNCANCEGHPPLHLFASNILFSYEKLPKFIKKILICFLAFSPFKVERSISLIGESDNQISSHSLKIIQNFDGGKYWRKFSYLYPNSLIQQVIQLYLCLKKQNSPKISLPKPIQHEIIKYFAQFTISHKRENNKKRKHDTIKDDEK